MLSLLEYLGLDAVLQWWALASPELILRTYWYFFVLELPRYVLLNVLVLLVVSVRDLLPLARRRHQRARAALLADQPLLTVVVPGKNEGRHLYKLIRSLRAQTYQNFEIIVVDDGSTDDTPLIGQSLLQQGLIDRFLRNPARGGKASAANFGLRYARGIYVIHLDADCEFDPAALERVLLPFYLYRNVGAVGGNLKVRQPEKSLATTLQAIEYLLTISMGRTVVSYLGIYRLVSGAFGAFPRTILQDLGGWDVGPGLDGDITMRIRKLGYDVYFEPRALGYTSVPATFRALAKQRMRWSKSLVRFRLRKHLDVFRPGPGFRVSNAVASAENIFYNLVLDVAWWIHLVNVVLLANDGSLFVFFVSTFVLYGAAGVVRFLVALGLSEQRRAEWRLLPYLALLPLYNGYFLRAVRTIAYVREFFFFSSYDDSWNPAKSSRQARAHGS